jgi:hypothetical protein
MNAQKWWLIGVTGSAAVLLFSFLSFSSSAAPTRTVGARLQLLWPDFLAMPEFDRTVLVSAAERCNLEREPCDGRRFAKCLRVGARGLDARAPKGIAAHVERLLHRASLEITPAGCR